MHRQTDGFPKAKEYSTILGFAIALNGLVLSGYCLGKILNVDLNEKIWSQPQGGVWVATFLVSIFPVGYLAVLLGGLPFALWLSLKKGISLSEAMRLVLASPKKVRQRKE